MKKEQVSFIDTFASLAKINWLSSFKRDSQRLIRTRHELSGHDIKLSAVKPEIIKDIWAIEKPAVKATSYGALALEIITALNSNEQVKIDQALIELIPLLLSSHPTYDNPVSILKSAESKPADFGVYQHLTNEEGKIVVGRIAFQSYRQGRQVFPSSSVKDFKALSFSKAFGLPEYATRIDKRIAYRDDATYTQHYFYALYFPNDNTFNLLTDTFNMLSALNVLEGYNTAFSKRSLQQVCQWIKALCPSLSEEVK